MKYLCTIIYANRNRESERIRASFNSLKQQSKQNFEVVFVDYGSEPALVNQYENLCNDYPFVRFYHLPVYELLWNKSKALNFGILKSETPFIFIADVDLVFHSKTIELFNKRASEDKFQLFRLSYLGEKISATLSYIDNYDNLTSSRIGVVNGMILVGREALLQIKGFDQFFHFYGAEDEDLFSRLEKAGYDKEYCEEIFFYHNWHKSFSGTTDDLSTKPRIKNIMRINQRHFLRNREKGITTPIFQKEMGQTITEECRIKLRYPHKTFKIPNIKAHVEHFLREELKGIEGQILKVVFQEDPFYNSAKYKAKSLLGKQSQEYISMKEVNDMVLKEILFNYRDQNYSFKVEKDLKTIVFCLEL